MKKITADTLVEALAEATKHFDCSLTEIEFEVLQNPSNGIFGLWKKEAIIVATKKDNTKTNLQDIKHSYREVETKIQNNPQESFSENPNQQEMANSSTQSEQIDTMQSNATSDIDSSKSSYTNSELNDKVENNSKEFEMLDSNTEMAFSEYKEASTNTNKISRDNFNSFFYEKDLDYSSRHKPKQTKDIESTCKEVQAELTELLKFLPLELNRIHVEPYDNHTIFILLDGLDAALLIGQKGYRYKSLSYLLFNWINMCYGYNVRLEIAQFLKNQEDMMRSYLEPIIESVKLHGKGQTKPLDGVLTHIALKILRDELPNKYIVFRENADGEKYITISEFLNNHNNSNNSRNFINGFGSLPKY